MRFFPGNAHVGMAFDKYGFNLVDPTGRHVGDQQDAAFFEVGGKGSQSRVGQRRTLLAGCPGTEQHAEQRRDYDHGRFHTRAIEVEVIQQPDPCQQAGRRS